jgi:hypothetical protein
VPTVEYIVPPLPPQPPGDYRITVSKDEAKLLYAVLNSGPVVDAMNVAVRERGLKVKGVASRYTNGEATTGQGFARLLRSLLNEHGIDSQDAISIPLYR